MQTLLVWTSETFSKIKPTLNEGLLELYMVSKYQIVLEPSFNEYCSQVLLELAHEAWIEAHCFVIKNAVAVHQFGF